MIKENKRRKKRVGGRKKKIWKKDIQKDQDGRMLQKPRVQSISRSGCQCQMLLIGQIRYKAVYLT